VSDAPLGAGLRVPAPSDGISTRQPRRPAEDQVRGSANPSRFLGGVVESHRGSSLACRSTRLGLGLFKKVRREPEPGRLIGVRRQDLQGPRNSGPTDFDVWSKSKSLVRGDRWRVGVALRGTSVVKRLLDAFSATGSCPSFLISRVVTGLPGDGSFATSRLERTVLVDANLSPIARSTG
jgi:hypothetical protein